MVEMQIKGKAALVTGGGRGIGAAIAKNLAKEGANVAIASRTRKEIENTAKECEKFGVDALPIVCDISKDNDISKMVSAAVEKFGKIDILVNNAGVGWYENFRGAKKDHIKSTIDVNLYGLVAVTNAALEHMKDGIIINISSGAGKTGIPGFAVYCATKFGVIGFTESLAGEFDKIGVFSVCPGPVDTKLYYDIFKEHPTTKPEDIARVVIDTIKNPPAQNGAAIDVH